RRRMDSVESVVVDARLAEQEVLGDHAVAPVTANERELHAQALGLRSVDADAVDRVVADLGQLDVRVAADGREHDAGAAVVVDVAATDADGSFGAVHRHAVAAVATDGEIGDAQLTEHVGAGASDDAVARKAADAAADVVVARANDAVALAEHSVAV